jgi:hypothetical protein
MMAGTASKLRFDKSNEMSHTSAATPENRRAPIQLIMRGRSENVRTLRGAARQDGPLELWITSGGDDRGTAGRHNVLLRGMSASDWFGLQRKSLARRTKGETDIPTSWRSSPARLQAHPTLGRLDTPFNPCASSASDNPQSFQTWKLSPQPQRPFSFGLVNVKPAVSAFVS